MPKWPECNVGHKVTCGITPHLLCLKYVILLYFMYCNMCVVSLYIGQLLKVGCVGNLSMSSSALLSDSFTKSHLIALTHAH